jgi:hypothetical protein
MKRMPFFSSVFIAIFFLTLPLFSTVTPQSRPLSGTIQKQYVAIENIEVLRKFEGQTQYKLIYLKGYHHTGDGGEGWFHYDETKRNIDNGGTVVHGWVREYSGAVNVKWFGATANAESTTYAIQCAIDSDASEIFFPKGVYRLDGEKQKRILNLRSNLKLRGEAGTIFDFSYNPIGEHHSVTESYISGQGSVGKVYPVLKGATAGSSEMISPIPKLKTGDLVLIYSDDTVDRQQPVRRGEMLYIDHIEKGNRIVFQHSLHDTYRTNPHIAKVTPLENVTFENITFIGSGRDLNQNKRSDLGVVIQYGRNISIKNCRFRYIDNTAVDLESVIGFHIENNRIMFQQKGNNKHIQYGIKYSNASSDGYIVSNRIYNGKHAIVQGHTRRLPGISRHITISGNFISGTWHAAIVTHGSGDIIIVSNNQIYGCERGIETRNGSMSITANSLNNIHKQAIVIKDDSKSILVANNEIDHVGLFGIHIYKLRYNRVDIMVSNNMILHSYGGIFVKNEQLKKSIEGVSLFGNTISTVKTYGIYTIGRVSVDIDSNRVSDIGKSAIEIHGNHHASIGQNRIRSAKVGIYLNSRKYPVEQLKIFQNRMNGVIKSLYGYSMTKTIETDIEKVQLK